VPPPMMIAPEIQSCWLVKKNSMRVSVTGAGLIRQAARPGGRRARLATVGQWNCGFELGRAPPQERRNPAFGLGP
jgi:hypothetical protein